MVDLEARLRGAGVRVTPQRLAVLSVLDRAGRESAHLLVSEVAERSREILGHISHQTVYTCLDVLVDAGLARRVALPGAAVRFELGAPGGHEHLVCRRCARLTNVPAAPVGVRDRPSFSGDRGGFRVDYDEVLHVGLCARCRSSGR